jgi:transcriptional regulator with XRE-family HTH domain
MTRPMRTATAVDAHVGRRVRLLRKQRGMSQQQLAEAIGVTFQQVQKYERGTNRISASTLVAIAQHLGVRPADLLEGFNAGEEVAPLNPALGMAGAEDLLMSFAAIRSAEVRRSLLRLVSAMARQGAEE